MAVIGGDIIEVPYNHPTLGSGNFPIKSGEDMTFDAGGIRTDDDMASVAGNSQIIKKMNRKRWMVEGVMAWDMIDANELEVLSQLAGDPVDSEFTFTHINGTVWAGEGTIVGDIQGATQNASIPVKFSGGGRLAKI